MGKLTWLDPKPKRVRRRRKGDRRELKSVRRHPAMKGKERGVWHPELAGKVPGYPRSEEAFQLAAERCRAMVTKANAAGTAKRIGIPNGWGGTKRRAMLEAMRTEAREEAKEIVATMKKEGILPADDPRGDEAIEYAIGVVRAPEASGGRAVYTVKDKLAAAKLVAEFCKTKPVTRQQTTLETAEDFLSQLAKKATGQE